LPHTQQCSILANYGHGKIYMKLFVCTRHWTWANLNYEGIDTKKIAEPYTFSMILCIVKTKPIKWNVRSKSITLTLKFPGNLSIRAFLDKSFSTNFHLHFIYTESQATQKSALIYRIIVYITEKIFSSKFVTGETY